MKLNVYLIYDLAIYFKAISPRQTKVYFQNKTCT